MVSERVIIKSFSKKLEHLGIIASIIDWMEIVDLVNDRLPKHRHHKVTHGDVVKALILNGLGFVQRRLYLFPEYFENKAVHFLFLTPPQKMEIISTLSVLSLSETSEMWTRVL